MSLTSAPRLLDAPTVIEHHVRTQQVRLIRWSNLFGWGQYAVNEHGGGTCVDYLLIAVRIVLQDLNGVLGAEQPLEFVRFGSPADCAKSFLVKSSHGIPPVFCASVA